MNEMLSGHKKVKMVLGVKFQDKTKFKRRNSAMQEKKQKDDSREALLF